jgi:hypothetical protein
MSRVRVNGVKRYGNHGQVLEYVDVELTVHDDVAYLRMIGKGPEKSYKFTNDQINRLLGVRNGDKST